VVERPASVVKELLENAIDAGSTRITIDIEKGGKNLIRVADNGSGMSRDNAVLAIERYATSKIHTDADLFSIDTLGFRGEALPSIASVSEFTLVSRRQDTDSGTAVTISGGKLKNITEAGAPPGTMITVEKLFYNVPARRKFLKSINTEMGHITDTVSSIALGWPSITFKLTHNGKMVKNWPQTKFYPDRIAGVLGSELRNNLHDVTFSDGYTEIQGWISSPHYTRSNSYKIFTYVNGRHIRDRGLLHALLDGYRGRIMKGRFPLAAVFITIPFDQLDVNVHPTKHEVRFANRNRIYHPLKNIVIKALGTAEQSKWQKETSDSQVNESRSRIHQIRDSIITPPKTNQTFEFEFPDKSEQSDTPDKPTQLDRPEIQNQPKTFENYTESSESVSYSDRNTISEKQYDDLSGVEAHESKNTKKNNLTHETTQSAETSHHPAPRFSQDLYIIGQYKNTYILCGTKDQLILIDQHAAHERIVYEELKQKSREGKVSSQKLLIPETLEFSYKEKNALETLIPELEKTGFEIEPFGGSTFVIKALPAVLSDATAAEIITDIVETMVQSGFNRGTDHILDDSIALMSCHSAIRANQSLTESQMRGLLSQLDQCENRAH